MTMAQEKLNVLITGGTGLLGLALLGTAGEGYRLTLLHRRNYILQANGIEQCILDILDQERLNSFFAERDIDVVIHTAGIANVDPVEQRLVEGWRSNVVGTQNIVDFVCKKKMRLVYIYSNAVFDGTCAPYKEND